VLCVAEEECTRDNDNDDDERQAMDVLHIAVMAALRLGCRCREPRGQLRVNAVANLAALVSSLLGPTRPHNNASRANQFIATGFRTGHIGANAALVDAGAFTVTVVDCRLLLRFYSYRFITSVRDTVLMSKSCRERS
jgi:hypothetical protein